MKAMISFFKSVNDQGFILDEDHIIKSETVK